MSMTRDELLQVADDYVGSKKELDAAKGDVDMLKNSIVQELEMTSDTKFDFGNGLTAAKQGRKGVVDIKKLQIKYGISDSDLDMFRKADTSSWVLKVKK